MFPALSNRLQPGVHNPAKEEKSRVLNKPLPSFSRSHFSEPKASNTVLYWLLKWKGKLVTEDTHKKNETWWY